MAREYDSPSTTVQNNVGIASFVLFYCVYTPIVVYWVIQLLREGKTNIAIQKRHIKVTLLPLLCVALHVVMDYPLWYAYLCFGSSFSGFLTAITYPLMLYGNFWSLAFRYFVLFYELNLSMATTNSQWKEIINPTANSQNWFLTNMKTWGNIRWCRWVFLIFYAISVGFSAIIWGLSYSMIDIISYGTAGLIDTLNMSVPYAIIVALWYYTPDFYDNFMIRREARLLLLSLSAMILSYVLYALLTLFIHSHKSAFFIVAITGHVFTWFHIWNLLVITRWALRNISVNRAFRNTTLIARVASLESMDVAGAEQHTTAADIGLMKMLSHNRTFEIVMRSLCKEFSQECLLSYIEFYQLQQLLLETIPDNDGEYADMKSELKPEQWPPIVPQSGIVSNETMDLRHKIFAIFNKYVKANCDYEINISGPLRTQIYSVFDRNITVRNADGGRSLPPNNIWIDYSDDNPTEMGVQQCKLVFLLLQQCQHEMRFFLNNCFRRFKRSTAYENIAERIASYITEEQQPKTSNPHSVIDLMQIQTL